MWNLPLAGSCNFHLSLVPSNSASLSYPVSPEPSFYPASSPPVTFPQILTISLRVPTKYIHLHLPHARSQCSSLHHSDEVMYCHAGKTFSFCIRDERIELRAGEASSTRLKRDTVQVLNSPLYPLAITNNAYWILGMGAKKKDSPCP